MVDTDQRWLRLMVMTSGMIVILSTLVVVVSAVTGIDIE
jgi:hypothetical protein